MQGLRLCTLALALTAALPLFADDQTLLQGSWNVLFFDSSQHHPSDKELKSYKVTIQGDVLTFDMGRDKESNAFTLNETASPKRMDLHEKDGRVDGLFIYEVTPNSLKLCWATSKSQRPTEFTSKGNEGLLILERNSRAESTAEGHAAPPGLLDGIWQVIRAEAGEGHSPTPEEIGTMKLRIHGGNIDFTSTKLAESYGLSLDPSTEPKSMEMTKEKNHEVAHAIYDLKGDELTICFGQPGSPRPEKFEVQPRVMLMTMRKIASAPPAASKDMKLLEGHWNVVHAAKNGHEAPPEEVKSMKMIFLGNSATLQVGSHSEVGHFQLNESTLPKTLDLSVDRDSKGAALFIYELNGDHLQLCWAKAGNARPTEFKAEASEGFLVLERAPE